jgi:hypothetical protein
MEDFLRQVAKKHFPELSTTEQAELLRRLPPEKREDVLQSLPPEERLAGLTREQIQAYLAGLSARPSGPTRKSRRKK